MTQVYVSVGSNIDRHINIYAGVNVLRQRYGTLQLSSIYETEAVGFDGDPFFNLVVMFETEEPPLTVNEFLKAVEEMQGRDHLADKFSSLTLDMDILLYGVEEINLPGVEGPREEIFRYAFVLQPLAEIAPDIICPGRTETFSELWENYQASHHTTGGKAIDWQIL